MDLEQLVQNIERARDAAAADRDRYAAQAEAATSNQERLGLAIHEASLRHVTEALDRILGTDTDSV